MTPTFHQVQTVLALAVGNRTSVDLSLVAWAVPGLSLHQARPGLERRQKDPTS